MYCAPRASMFPRPAGLVMYRVAGRPIGSNTVNIDVRSPWRQPWRGMGAGPSQNQIASGIVSGASIGAGTAVSTGSILAGAGAGTLLAIAPFTGPAAPFLAAAGALIAPIAALFKGCGQTCTQATQYANQAETALQQLKAQYFAQPVRYASTQAATLQLMDQTFQQLQSACSNPALGPAGQRCISERLVRGGSAPWCPTRTGCDWITTLRDPVALDTGVVADPSSLSSLFAGGGSSSDSWLLPAALGLLAVGILAG